MSYYLVKDGFLQSNALLMVERIHAIFHHQTMAGRTSPGRDFLGGPRCRLGARHASVSVALDGFEHGRPTSCRSAAGAYFCGIQHHRLRRSRSLHTKERQKAMAASRHDPGLGITVAAFMLGAAVFPGPTPDCLVSSFGFPTEYGIIKS